MQYKDHGRTWQTEVKKTYTQNRCIKHAHRPPSSRVDKFGNKPTKLGNPNAHHDRPASTSKRNAITQQIHPPKTRRHTDDNLDHPSSPGNVQQAGEGKGGRSGSIRVERVEHRKSRHRKIEEEGSSSPLAAVVAFRYSFL